MSTELLQKHIRKSTTAKLCLEIQQLWLEEWRIEPGSFSHTIICYKATTWKTNNLSLSQTPEWQPHFNLHILNPILPSLLLKSTFWLRTLQIHCELQGPQDSVMILSGFTGWETAERPEKCNVEALQLLAICSQVLHNAKLFQEVARQQTIHPYCLNSHSNTSSLSQSDDIGLWEMQNFRQQSVLLQALGSSHHSGHGLQCVGSRSFPEKKNRMDMFSGICQGLEIHPE